MPSCSFHCMHNTEPACSAHTNHVSGDTRLRPQELQRSLNILRCSRALLATAFAEATHVEGESVDTGHGELCCCRGPRLPITIALMKQQDTWAGLRCGKESCL